MNRINLPLEHIKKKYLKGETLNDIAKIYNVNRGTIKNRLLEMGVQLRPVVKKKWYKCVKCGKRVEKAPWEIKRSPNVYCSNCFSYQKYEYNKNYFEEINTPIKSYFLGFIMGDGYLRFSSKPPRYGLVFGIHQRDKIILETLIQQIGGHSNQIKKGINDQVRLNIANKKISEDLINLGVPFKDKSYTAEPLDVPEEFENSFWLGLFDADGSVGHAKYERKRGLQLRLVGTKKICQGFSKFLGYKGKKVYKHKGVYEFNLCTSDSKKMIKLHDKLYNGALFGLPRKRQKFIEIIKYRLFYEENLINVFY